MNKKNYKKINIKTVISIQQCKICPKSMSDKNFGKTNFKMVISIQQCARVPNFSNLENFRFWDQICPEKCDKNFGKINIELKMRIQQCTPVPNFSQFGELQFAGQFQVVSDGFRWFQVVSRFNKYGIMLSFLKQKSINNSYEKESLQELCVLYKKALLKNFAIFTGKYLPWSLLLLKLQDRERLQHIGVSCRYCENLKNTFFK